MPPDALPYRDFPYPLNVFMHVLTQEEGGVSHLHYGLFERPDEPIRDAQEHSTELLVNSLPPPPARVLEVGAGLGTTLARLTRLGYDVVGITPDEKQIAMVRERYGDAVRIEQIAFEDFPPRPVRVVVFQESSQYIDATVLFAKAAKITEEVIVIDEFATRSGGTLHRLDGFLRAASGAGFTLLDHIDLSSKAAPTVDYFIERLPRYRGALISDLGLTSDQIDELIASGARYREQYATGGYVYRLLRFCR
ncbi:MAG TPA: methyltransferase domain-containing protein [Thermoanaerobaculia bacterium]